MSDGAEIRYSSLSWERTAYQAWTRFTSGIVGTQTQVGTNLKGARDNIEGYYRCDVRWLIHAE